jgi:Mrr N-terminal domain
MPVPDFQTLMRPLLEEYAAGGERPIAEVRAALASKFALTPEELAERLPSGLAKTFDNRVGWLGVVPMGDLALLEHGLMMPVMLVPMLLRPGLYAQHMHHVHA